MTRTLIATALLAAFAVGCGSRQSPPGVASVDVGASARPPASAGATATADPQEQGRKFAQCMRDHGVPMEDPDPNKGGGLRSIGTDTNKKKLAEALDACRAYAPAKLREGLKPEDVEQLRQLAQCMRENGVDMPDPNPDGTFPSGSMGKLKRDDPKFKTAFEACNQKFPREGGKK
ncbi:hypothetical protein [Nonomuraea sp. NPDC049784]|uniref:hypothetical protein n=1 Tax=Nonomuraea sp. NPDC049784 TaxID=3154361 RepID=UPI0033E5E15B